MEKNKVEKIKAAIAIGVIFLILIYVGIIMLKYNIEGEKNMPFELTELTIISSAEAKYGEKTENGWTISVNQTNDFYFKIEKNDNYKKEEIIKNVVIKNIKYENQEGKKLNAYMPNSLAGTTFNMIEDFKIKDKLEYKGADKTELKDLTIGNQGGLIVCRFANEDLGTLSLNENESLKMDGELIKKVNKEIKDLKYKVTFDLEINLDGKIFSTTVNVDLPVEKVIEEGIANIKLTKEDFVFKRK